jgi:uncharacterized protein (UPF0335 family)
MTTTPKEAYTLTDDQKNLIIKSLNDSARDIERFRTSFKNIPQSTNNAMKKIDTNSLDPPVMKTKDKLRKLRDELIREREHLYEQITTCCESGARLMIDTIADVARAKDGIQKPTWGSWGPIQGNYGAKVDALAGQLYQIEQTLEMIHKLWPKLAPSMPAKPKTAGQTRNSPSKRANP